MSKIRNGAEWGKSSCVVKDCTKKGVYAPTMHILAGREHGEHPPAIMEMDALFCAGCRSKIKTIQDLLSPDSVQTIEWQFSAHGKAQPDWARTRIRWRYGIASEIMPKGS